MKDDDKIYRKRLTKTLCCIPSTEEINVTNEYIKRSDIKLADLEENEKHKLTEEAVLQSGVDGSEITWKDFLREVNSNIRDLKLRYLRKQKKFASIWSYYDNKQKLAALKVNTMPDNIDTIRDENGTEISKDKLTEQVIDNIKKAAEGDYDEKKKPYTDLYDAKENKLVNDTNYDLSKINTYQVALVIPKALLEAK